jgi:hypothetical protein
MNIYRPDLDLYCMDVKCHFNQNGIPPNAFEHALAERLFNSFSLGNTATPP